MPHHRDGKTAEKFSCVFDFVMTGGEDSTAKIKSSSLTGSTRGILIILFCSLASFQNKYENKFLIECRPLLCSISAYHDQIY